MKDRFLAYGNFRQNINISIMITPLKKSLKAAIFQSEDMLAFREYDPSSQYVEMMIFEKGTCQ